MPPRTGTCKALISFTVLLAISAGAQSSGELADAVSRGDRDRALELLAQGTDVNGTQPDGTTALHWAAHLGDVELVERLIAAGADVEASNDYGATALAEAAMIGDSRVIELLLDAGVDPNVTNAEGETALMIVARTGNLQAARALLAAGADINAREQWGGQTALMWAAAQLQPAMVALLIDHGADVNARGIVRNWTRRITAEARPKDMNKGGFTPLLYAARGGCLECAKHLIDSGADIDLADPDGVSPLLIAVINFEIKLAEYLISAGANVDKWDIYGRTPLYSAVDINTIAAPDRPGAPSLAGIGLARKLLEAGANPNIQLKLRRPPFRNAIGERGADNSLTTGATPLLRAAHASDNESIILLINHGAVVDLPNAAGLSPLMAAAGLGVSPRANRARYKTEETALESVRLLLDAGASTINTRIADPRRLEHEPDRDLGGAVRYNSVHMPPDGQTALHGAARKGWSDMVRLLVSNGAAIDVVDVNGRTPWHMAMGRYDAEPLDPPSPPVFPETATVLEELCRASDSCALERLVPSD